MNELAVFGGKSVIPNNAHRQYPPIGDRERKFIGDVLDSGILWGPWAPKTRELEQAWASRVNVRYCAALNSGTAALHCAVVGCGIGPGDEVIVPAYSFIASASSVMMAGGIPIFVDITPHGNIDPTKIEAAVTNRTKAIMVVHLHGLPADLDAISAIATRFSLQIIEDCAQAHGASFQNRPVGSIGDVGAFSLNATKALAGPEGGLLTTNREDIYNRAAKMRVFGAEWHEGQQIFRDADSIGYNYRGNELTAAFTLARLEALSSEQQVRNDNARRLTRGLSELKGLMLPNEPSDRTHIYNMIRIRLDPAALGIDMDASVYREKVIRALQAEGAIWWIWERKALPAYRLFQTKNIDGGHYPWCLPQAREDISYLPESYPISVATAKDSIYTTAHFPPNSTALMDQYVEAFLKVWRNLDEVLRIEVPPVREGYTQPF